MEKVKIEVKKTNKKNIFNDFDYNNNNHNIGVTFFLNCRECGIKFSTQKVRVVYCSDKCRNKIYGLNSPMKKRFLVLLRDNFTCKYCGRNPKLDNVSLEADHIIPKSKGGTSEMSNLITACSECNVGKGNLLIETK